MRSYLKLVSLTCALVVAMACWTLAQTYGTETQEHSQGQMAGHEQMRAKSAQERLDWLSQQLNLTDDQKAKLLPILQSQDQQFKAVHDNSSLTQEQRRDQIRQIQQSTQPQIQSVLTPEQRQKFAQLKEEHQRQHEGAMGSGEQSEPKQ